MSSAWFVLTVACLVLWGIAIVVLVAATAACIRPRRREPTVPLPDPPPPLALIRPMAGVEHRMGEVTRSVLDQDHPDIDIVFAVSSGTDPALAHLHELQGDRPGRFRIVHGERRQGRNPKLNNMAGGVEGVRADHLFFSDANTLLPPDAARRRQAQAIAVRGIVSALPEGIDPRSFPAWVECAFLNQHQLRLGLLLASLGVPLVHGKAMVLSRRHFETLGGIRALSRHPAEDFAMAKAATAAGIPVRLSDETARTPLGPRSWADVTGRQRRWARYRAASAPISLVAEFMVAMVPSGIAGAFAHASLWQTGAGAFLVGHALAWIVCDAAVAWARGQAIGGATPLASLCREALLPWVLAAGMVGDRVDWGGEVFHTKRRR